MQESILIRIKGNVWLFKHVENANLFMASRPQAIAKKVCSSLYHIQFADSVPTAGAGDFVRV